MQGRQVVATSRRSVGARDTVLEDRGWAVQAAPVSPELGQPHRLRLVQAAREVVEEASRALAPPAGAAADDFPVRLELIVAAGMLSSEIGLAAVPHVVAPASLDDLARGVAILHLPEIAALPIHFVPGIRTPSGDGPDGWFEADVMRGEECETWGAYTALRAAGQLQADQWPVFLWPGSHTKLVELDPSGRITRSYTTLAGELLQAAARHTVLAASLPEMLPETVAPDAAAAAARVLERQGLGRAAFLVRIAAITQALDQIQRASFWIGAVVAADVIDLLGHPILMAGRSVWVGGRQPLRWLYAESLARRHQGPVLALEDSLAESASALGALEIATRRLRFGHMHSQK
jgi:2-dehydro-3-deoxygalactonokinase